MDAVWFRNKSLDYIQLYGLVHAVVMMSLKIEVTSAFFFVIFQLADYDHRLHTYVMDSIRRKRKFLPQTLWSKSEVCEEGYFYKSPFY